MGVNRRNSDLDEGRACRKQTASGLSSLSFDQRMRVIVRQRIVPDDEPDAPGQRRYERAQPEAGAIRASEAFGGRSETREIDRDARIRLTAQFEGCRVDTAIGIDVLWGEPTVQHVIVGDGFEVSQTMRLSRYREQHRGDVFG